MHSFDRQDDILKILNDSGQASVRRLAQLVHVSEPTMRRDLKHMEASGLIRRTHGGAVSLSRGARVPLSLRSEEDAEQKKMIAQRAAALISDGATVFFDASSTSRFIPHYLREGQNFTAVCNSLGMCRQLTELRIPTYCVGGRINSLDDAIRGLHAENFLRSMHFDLCFFSCSALSSEGVLSGQWEEGVSFLRALLRQSARRVFLCTSGKLDRSAPHVICDLADVDQVLSDAPLPPDLQAMVGQRRRG